MRCLVIASGFMGLILVLAACGGETEKKPTVTPTRTLIPSPTSTATPSPTPTSTPTSTPLPVGFSNRSWTPVVEDVNGVEMMFVPAGCFMMGGDGQEPAHEVCLDAFWIDRTEVTYARYELYDWVYPFGNWTAPGRPVGWMSWTEANDFCAATNWEARLPTEAEWEYAARGPEGWLYPWGNEFVSENAVWAENSGGQTAEAVSKPGGVSWVGALDMSGNVWEWVADGDDGSLLPAQPERSSNSLLEGVHVARGGAWITSDPALLRASYRGRFLPTSEFFFIGFRCARSATE